MSERVQLAKALRAIASLIGVLLLAAFALALHHTDQAVNLIDTVEAFDDPSAEMTLPLVLAQRFEPASVSHKAGYDAAAHWFRIRLTPMSEASDVFLEVAPFYLDSITLYVRSAQPRQWHVERSGDAVPLAQRDQRRVALGFVIPQDKVQTVLYLRVANATSNSLMLNAAPVADADRQFARLTALHTVYFALLGMGLGLAGVRCLEKPTAQSLSLFGVMAVYFLTSLWALGYATVLFDEPDASLHDQMTAGSATLTALLSMLFQRLYLQRHGPNRWALGLADLVIFLQALCFVPLVMGELQVAGLSSALCSLGFVVTLLAMLVTARIEDPVIRAALIPAYAVYIIITVIWLVVQLGFVAGTEGMRHVVEVFGLNTLFLALVLTMLDRRQRLAQQRSSLVALATARAGQASHRRNTETQDNFMHMLVHEVRNHLSVLQLSLPRWDDPVAGKKLGAAIRDLDRALVTARQTIWLSQGKWPQRPVRVFVLEALDRAIDGLGLTDRVTLQGDAFEAMVNADAAIIEALFERILRATTAIADARHPVTITITQAAHDAPCTIDVAVQSGFGAQPGRDAGENVWNGISDLSFAMRLAEAVKGTVSTTVSAGTLCLSLRLPR